MAIMSDHPDLADREGLCRFLLSLYKNLREDGSNQLLNARTWAENDIEEDLDDPGEWARFRWTGRRHYEIEIDVYYPRGSTAKVSQEEALV